MTTVGGRQGRWRWSSYRADSRPLAHLRMAAERDGEPPCIVAHRAARPVARCRWCCGHVPRRPQATALAEVLGEVEGHRGRGVWPLSRVRYHGRGAHVLCSGRPGRRTRRDATIGDRSRDRWAGGSPERRMQTDARRDATRGDPGTGRLRCCGGSLRRHQTPEALRTLLNNSWRYSRILACHSRFTDLRLCSKLQCSA